MKSWRDAPISSTADAAGGEIYVVSLRPGSIFTDLKWLATAPGFCLGLFKTRGDAKAACEAHQQEIVQ